MPTEIEANQSLTDGERVSPLVNDSCFQAHLSIYEFAQPWCQGRTVLDAGSGTGYGSANLADHGAAFVEGIELDAEAVAFSQAHFQRPNLRFQIMDLAAIHGFADRSFDVIFSSNVLEHVADIPTFLHTAVKLLTNNGMMIVAVPPITTTYLRAANLINPFHVNIWSPHQWDACFQHYFADVAYYSHWLGQPGQVLDFNLPLPEVVPSSAWSITPVPLEDLGQVPTLTAIFVLQQPLPAEQLPPLGAPMRYVDGSFTRTAPDPLATDLAALVVQQAQQLEHQHAQLGQQTHKIAELEQLLTTKNLHIQHCESLIQRLENGRVMRLLGWLAARQRAQKKHSKDGA